MSGRSPVGAAHRPNLPPGIYVLETAARPVRIGLLQREMLPRRPFRGSSFNGSGAGSPLPLQPEGMGQSIPPPAKGRQRCRADRPGTPHRSNAAGVTRSQPTLRKDRRPRSAGPRSRPQGLRRGTGKRGRAAMPALTVRSVRSSVLRLLSRDRARQLAAAAPITTSVEVEAGRPGPPRPARTGYANIRMPRAVLSLYPGSEAGIFRPGSRRFRGWRVFFTRSSPL